MENKGFYQKVADSMNHESVSISVDQLKTYIKERDRQELIDNHKWHTVVAQHCYVPEYPPNEDGRRENISLCGRWHMLNESEMFAELHEIEGEVMEDNCCKICKKVWNRKMGKH